MTEEQFKATFIANFFARIPLEDQCDYVLAYWRDKVKTRAEVAWKLYQELHANPEAPAGDRS